MARKMCDCGVRPVATKRDDADANAAGMCGPCWGYAGWENTHSDDDHAGITAGHGVDSPNAFDAILADMVSCPVCHPELDSRTEHAPAPVTRPQNQPATHMRHRDHRHAATNADRTKCRASIASNGHPYADPDWKTS